MYKLLYIYFICAEIRAHMLDEIIANEHKEVYHYCAVKI